MSTTPIEQPSAGAARAEIGPPAGFGRGTNEYLNHYVNVADAKAASVVGAALALIAFQFSQRLATATHSTLGMIALIACLAAAACGLASVFPRLPKGKQGVLFWEDIRNYGTEEGYLTALRGLTSLDMEATYARQNFQVSKVLHSKLTIVRWAIALLSMAVIVSVAVAWRA